MNAVQGSANDVARSAYSGVAAATALAMIPDVDSGKTVSIGIGNGNFKGYSAVAMGLSARVTQNLIVKSGVGYSSSGTTAGVSVGYRF
ncbi:hypothetical protein WK99_10365 [Burkholderia ubonensis]|nr:hypothetical protein WK99_10365 [Burkholderia ubonensis]